MIANIQELKKQPALAELLIALIANQNKYIRTLDLLGSGVLSPAAGIARLKAKGVVMETIYQTITDSSGRPRKRVACYKIVGGAVL